MSITDNNVVSGNEAPKQNNQSAKLNEKMASQFSFHNSAMFSGPISRSVGSETYRKLKANMAECFKDVTPEIEVALIDLDTTVCPSLAFSTLIVAVRNKEVDTNSVAYHLLILEATGEPLTPIYENINGQNIEVPRFTSDALDDELMKQAKDAVVRAFPRARDIFYCDATVIPRKFNVENKADVHNIAFNSSFAGFTQLTIADPAFQDTNLTKWKHDSQLNVNIGFSRQQVLNIVGEPMRAELAVNFASKRIGDNRRISVNAGGAETKISEISGYIDLVWAPVSNVGYSPYVTQVAVPTQKYAARLVITNLASNCGYTPATLLLAIATAVTVRDNNNWYQAFRPTLTGKNTLDITDVGALNIEANILNDASGVGTRIDTKAENFRLEDLGQLLTAFVQPGLTVSIDCPNSGPQSHYMSLIAAAPTNSSATRILLAAADCLTDGNFGRMFPVGASIFADSGSTILMGSWTDKDGNNRDIRDIDHVAVCNITGNPQAIRDYSDTITKTEFPAIQRLAAQKKMISAYTSETAVFTGTATRHTFSRDFINALVAGVNETKLPIKVNTPMSGNEFNNARGVAGFVAASAVAPGTTFAYGGGFAQNNSQFNPHMNNYRF